MTGAMSLLCQLLLSIHPRPEIYVPSNTDCLASSTNISLDSDACLTSTCSESDKNNLKYLWVFRTKVSKEGDLAQNVEKPMDIYRVLPLFNVSSDSYVCLTPGCVKAAAEISANLDENVRPCDDFYQFACGGWMDRHSIPDDSSSISIYSKIVTTLNNKLRSLLEKELTRTEPDFIQMLKQLYDSCMDIPSIDEVGSMPLENVLQNLGGWPVVEGEKWEEASFDWLDTVIEFRRRGFDFNIFMSFDVTQDYKNNTAHIIELDQPGLGLSRKDWLSGLNNSLTNAYFKLMVKAANKLGSDKHTSEDELKEVIHFVALLANLTKTKEERRDMDAMYHKYTVNQLTQEVPKINWMKYFNGLLKDEVFENDTLINLNPSFIEGVADLINTTDKRVLANFLMWTLVGNSMHQLSKDWKALFQEFKTATKGEIQEKPRWRQCLSPVSGYLGVALSFYYVQNYFKEDNRDAVLEIVGYIRNEFLKMLENLDWIEEGTKQRAKEKAEAMRLHIGFPKELLNDSYVSDLYKDLKFNTSESYFSIRRKLDIWQTDQRFSHFRKPYIKGLWKNHAMVAIVNAYYRAVENSMRFPAGVLQEPLYSNDRPEYLNFGSIGSVIGHEITHGFDDIGRQFDENGNNMNWWDDVTDQRFKTKARCIIEQYGNYTAENGMQLNGVNTQGENLADNGGMKAAFLAYKSWTKEHGSEPTLPGLNYTPNQLFWISVANVWCNKIRPEALRAKINQGSHTPMRFRVIGPMSNLPEFAEEFNCSSESAMVRKNRCHIW